MNRAASIERATPDEARSHNETVLPGRGDNTFGRKPVALLPPAALPRTVEVNSLADAQRASPHRWHPEPWTCFFSHSPTKASPAGRLGTPILPVEVRNHAEVACHRDRRRFHRRRDPVLGRIPIRRRGAASRRTPRSHRSDAARHSACCDRCPPQIKGTGRFRHGMPRPPDVSSQHPQATHDHWPESRELLTPPMVRTPFNRASDLPRSAALVK